MKKTLITILIAILMLTLTIYSASAIEIEAINNSTIHVGQEYSAQLNIEYENMSELNYELITSPAGMTLENLEISWVPKLTNSDIGNHSITINVSNSTTYETISFTLEVIYNAFTMSLNTASAPNSAIVNQEYKFKLEATSNYPQAVEKYIYNLNEGPEGMILLNNELIWTPTLNQFGSYVVRVSAIPENAPSNVEPIIREFDVNVQGLTIDRVEVRSDSRRLETVSRSNYLSSSIPYVIDREATLGQEIELRISIKNNLPDESDNEIRDAELEIYSFDLINADGQESSIARLRPGRTEDQTITFLLDAKDLHPSDSPFDIEIRVFGETRGGDLYSDTWYLELRVESKSYDLIFNEILLSPTTACPGSRIRVTTELRNIGTRDLSNIGMRYHFLSLDINELDRNIEIEYDDIRTISKFLDIPNDVDPGEYFFEVTAYPRASSTSDTTTEIMMFTVLDCDEEDEEDSDDNGSIIVTPPSDNVVVPGIPITDASGTKSTSIFNKDGNIYVILLTALVVLLLIGVILLLIKVLN